MDNKFIYLGIILIACNSFFLGIYTYPYLPHNIKPNLQPSGDIFTKWLRCPECNTLSPYQFKIRCLVSQMDIEECWYCHHEIRFIVYYDHEVCVQSTQIYKTIVTQTITQIKEISPSYLEIPSGGWVSLGTKYFSYDWKGHMMGMHELHYCDTGMIWDGFSVEIGLIINVIGWGKYKITEMNEAYIVLTYIE